MDDLIAEFLTETAENLEVVDSELVKFEANPTERKTLDNIFRLVHTIKGTCGFLGLPRLEAVAHAGETLLGRFRDGKLEVTPVAVTLVLHAIDRIKVILCAIEQTGAEPDDENQDLIAQLEAMAQGLDVDVASVKTVKVPVRMLGAEVEAVLLPEIITEEQERTLRPGEVSEAELEAAFAAAEGPAWMAEPDAPPPEPVKAKTKAKKKAEPDAPVAPPEPVPAAGKPAPEPLPTLGAEDAQGPAGNTSIRVAVDVLEGLMTLVSEMVLTRNQLLQISRTREDPAFATPLQRLSALTGELQDSVMKTRMQPIGAAWKKLPRLIRDLSYELDKKIDLVMEGEATELDRQVLELIRDPLTHMVRNSADHGLETTAERLAAGKPANGTVTLSAFHEGGYIVIRLKDDGKGLNTAKIREKLLEKGMVSRADLDAMTEQQIHRYIFAPGFSTAAKVTSLSGRGVGMDVVRTNIEQIGGQIDLQSMAGQGTIFTIKIPLTLAIVSALIVGAGRQKFAVPQTAVMELVRTGGTSEHRIEKIDQALVLRLRNKLLPLVQLGPTLQLEESRHEDPQFVMVIQVGERRYGLVVNDVLDTEEIVVKPLASILRSVDVFSGATILGDGSVILILDPNALSERAGEIVDDKAFEYDESNDRRRGQRIALLMFKAGSGAPKAVELSHITRLEHIESTQIEQLGGRATLQYRRRLMPVLTVNSDYSGLLGSRTTEPHIQPMLVLTVEGYAMGLAVDEIIDVVEDRLEIELSADRPGVRGTAIIAGKACEILDVSYYHLRGLAEHQRHPAHEERAVA